jgi:ankyrin repeat protein
MKFHDIGVRGNGAGKALKHLTGKAPLVERIGHGTALALAGTAVAGLVLMAMPQKANAQLDSQLVKQVESGINPVNGHAKDGITSLMMVAQNGSTETVEWLLKHGADPNARNDYGVTAFMYSIPGGAPEGKYIKKIELCLEHGADVNAKDNSGWTALSSAAFHGYTEITRLLLKYHADVNATDNYGKNALMVAVVNWRTEVVRLLLDNGADVGAKDQNGKTALDMANDSSEIAKLLRAKMTK